VTTVDLGSRVWAEFAIEYERTSKSEQKSLLSKTRQGCEGGC
jgi:hypothetical protein